MDEAAQYRRGFLITFLGVMIMTPDALLIRLIDTDPWTLAFWRGFLIPTVLLLSVGVLQGFKSIWSDFRDGGRVSFGVSIAYAGIGICFVLALHNTAVANVLVIIASAPLFAAVLSAVFLRESVSRATWIAISVGIVGIAIMMSEGLNGAGLFGDLLALAAALFLASTIVLMRRGKDVSMIPAISAGGYLAALIALPFATPLALGSEQAQFILLLCVVLLPLSFGLIAIGPRHVPAPEVSLLLLLETILGPLWVWSVLSEMPSLLAFIGGGIVVLALIAHGVWKLTLGREKPGSGSLGSIFDGLDADEIKRLSSD